MEEPCEIQIPQLDCFVCAQAGYLHANSALILEILLIEEVEGYREAILNQNLLNSFNRLKRLLF